MNNIKVLIVEDEILLGLDLKKTIEKLGYQVTNIAKNANNALKSIMENEPTVIMMDIHLKNSIDGIETAVNIKEIKEIPIIFLTAFTDEETIKRAVQVEPMGYLTKPYKIEDLKTTIHLALYKAKNNLQVEKKDYKHIGNNYYFDMHKLELYYNEIPIKLSKKEKMLICILLKAKGTIVSLEELEYEIWHDEPASSSSLRTLIYRLRSKLDYKVIDTIPYHGCKINVI